jgi:flagellar protein FlaG
MSGVSVSHLVLFIASLVVAAGLAGTLVTEVDRVSQSVSRQGDEVSETIETDIEATSDTGSGAIYNSSGTENVTVLVNNTGSRTLAADAGSIDVLVDGVFIATDNVTVTRADGSGDRAWPQESVVRLEIDRSLAPGDHRVTARVHGNEAVLRFRV